MSVPFMDYRGRIKKLQGLISEKGYDAVVLSKIGSLCYFTGLVFKDRAAIIIPAKGGDDDIYMVNINIEIERMREESWLPNLIAWDFSKKTSGVAPQSNVVHTFNPAYVEAIGECLSKLKLEKGKIGIEKDDLVATEYEALVATLRDARIENVADIPNRMQVVKDKAEIEVMRRAAEITDAGMEAAFKSMVVGATECEVAGAAEYAMRLAGAESFNYGMGGRIGTEIGSGYRSAYMYCWSLPPSQKRLQRGDVVTVDIHAMHQNYVSDLSLNAVLGEPSEAQKELEDVWKKGTHALLNAMKPGAKICTAAMAARSAIEAAGWAKYNAPLFGHGLGTSTRIPPIISMNNNDIFEINMILNSVVVITKPGVGGMRLEMPTLVTQDGGQPLSKSPLELVVRPV